MYNQIAEGIKCGKIPAGTRLPSVRMLSEEAKASKNTVTKAYSELEKDGFIYSESKRGYFVAEYKGSKNESPAEEEQEKESQSRKKDDNSIPTVDSILKQYAQNNESVAKSIILPSEEIQSESLLKAPAPKEESQAEEPKAEEAKAEAEKTESASVEQSTPEAAVAENKAEEKEAEKAPVEAANDFDGDAFFEKYLFESYKNILMTGRRKLLYAKSGPFGDESFRRVLADFIFKFHNIKASPENIIVGSGMEMLLWNVLQLKCMNTPVVKYRGLLNLANQASEGNLQGLKAFAAVAEDTAQSTKQIFLDANIPVREVPVDDQGISFDFLVTSGTTIVYVTPGDIPLGSFEDNKQRKQEILDWAKKVPYRYIIEYDTDTSKEADSLYKQDDDSDKVIYINSFSNLLCQGINAAFLILPKDVCNEYKQHYANFDCSLSYLDQLALTDFITKGHLESYLNSLEDL
ncbi:MAG: GntR family transcriptional regulator [Treponema sp.]|nr:GntR family transcriptional regulator [Treponema sp.]